MDSYLDPASWKAREYTLLIGSSNNRNTMNTRTFQLSLGIIVLMTASICSSVGQSTNAPRQRIPLGPQFLSPEVFPDRQIAFRILAPKATQVRLPPGDIQGLGSGTNM